MKCYTCGKKMPGIWDVKCFKCHNTFCYKHSYVVNGKWLCIDCLPAQYRFLHELLKSLGIIKLMDWLTAKLK